MQHIFHIPDEQAKLVMLIQEPGFSQQRFGAVSGPDFYTIVWNKGPAQTVVIDEIGYTLSANTVLPLMLNQTFRFEAPEQLVAWQFNREFYCVVNHDAEVGCVGLLFYGPSPTMFVQLDATNSSKLAMMQELFEEEFNTNASIKATMLRNHLVRLIVLITRIAKQQYLPVEVPDDSTYTIVRHFHLLVEKHYKKAHRISFYAEQLHKSPKTISNLFALYSELTPQEVIHNRIIAEAKRLLLYTDWSVKEIAAALGFEDAAHFSKFFSTQTGQNASEFRKNRPS
jgi:AraC-like DNA-binding protein